jgi:hypothetical protein
VAQPVGVGFAREQVSDERLGRRNELVTQYIPGSDLQPARGYKGANSPFFFRTNAEVVLD